MSAKIKMACISAGNQSGVILAINRAMNQSVNIAGATGKRLTRLLLFGNYFLALCIVALSYETTLKNNSPIKSIAYYVAVFFGVVIYYTYAYTNDKDTGLTANPRSLWYFRNRRFISVTQLVYVLLVIFTGVDLIGKYINSLLILSVTDIALLFIFPTTALLYYGVVFPASFPFRLRNIAWLKPFIIGFVCTGAIVIYPVMFSAIQQSRFFHLSLTNGFYFLTNWLFTTAIAVMFDIKDFAADHNYHLKTFVVVNGLRKTIFFILLPLSTGSFISFLVFAFYKDFSFLQIAINVIPFLLLLYASASFRRRRGILYYLVIIDGLLFVKALFGIAAMTLLK